MPRLARASKPRSVTKINELTLAKNIDRMFSHNQQVVHSVEGVPKYEYKKGHAVCVEQTEYIADIGGSVAFGNSQFHINAGNPALFPQLAKIAALYEEYCFTRLEFEYRPLVFDQSAGTTNNAMGYVGLGIQYDVTDIPYQMKTEALNSEGSVSCKPSDPMLLRIDVTKRKSNDNVLMSYYVRTNYSAPTYPTGIKPSTGNFDTRLCDYGQLNQFNGSQQSTGILGELWVHYRCCFWKQLPVVPSAPGALFQAKYNVTSFTATTADPFGSTAIFPIAGTSLFADFSNLTYVSIQGDLPFQSNWFLGVVYNTSANQSWTAVNWSVTSTSNGAANAVLQACSQGSTATTLTNYAVTSGKTYSNIVGIQILGSPDPQFGYQFRLQPTLPANCKVDFFFIQLNDSFTG